MVNVNKPHHCERLAPNFGCIGRYNPLCSWVEFLPIALLEPFFVKDWNAIIKTNLQVIVLLCKQRYEGTAPNAPP